MDAKNSRLKNLLDGTQQYLVPIYQREYSWEKEQWQQLWLDIAELEQDQPDDHHFLGSIVAKAYDAKSGGLTKFLLIDGQQRLTTLTLLLAAIRDALREDDDPESQKRADMIHDRYLSNRYEQGEDAVKVLPTKTDRPSYLSLVLGSDLDGQASANILGAYKFFRDSLNKAASSDKLFTPSLFLATLVERIEMVSITLGADDNDYRIFESLNAKGTPLTQTDLLRNFFLMRFTNQSKQESVYNSLIRPITSEISSVEGGSSDTMFQYSLQRRGVYVRDKDIYFQWKRATEGATPEELERALIDIKRDSANYLCLVDPFREKSAAVVRRLMRFKQLGILTPMPFILNAFRWREDKIIDDNGLARILQLIESYLVRRMFARVPTNALNRVFIMLDKQLPEGDKVQATHRALSAHGLRWPNDEDFHESFANHSIYADSRPAQRMLVLVSLEESFGNKESPVPNTATIEHVMPQTLTPAWREELGHDADRVHRNNLHRIGNLTLSAYNSELGNLPFDEKKKRYATSNFELNKMFLEFDHWNEDAIKERAKQLFERAKAIWISPLSID